MIIIISALFMFLLSPSITMYTMDEDIKLLREIGLSTLFLAGLFIAIFSATEAITEEIEAKTITTVLSKPIRRSTFVFGKFAGVAAAVILAHYICTIAMIMVVRHGVLETASDTHDWPVIVTAAAVAITAILLTAFLNYSYDWNFPSTAIVLTAVLASLGLVFLSFIDKQWQFNPQNNSISAFDVYATGLLLQAIIILVAVAVMFSTRFNVILTLTCCVATFLTGLVSDYAFGRFADTYLWARIGKVIIPNFQVFWISDAIYKGSSIPFDYIILGSAYAILYTAGMMALAIALFQRRQIG